MSRWDEAEKLEIIHLVEHSNLSVKRTLEELDVPRSTFYRWYQQYQEEGETGLIIQRPNPRQIWNRIPLQVKQQVVELALQHPDRSPRHIVPMSFGKLLGCLPIKKAISSRNRVLTAS